MKIKLISISLFLLLMNCSLIKAQSRYYGGGNLVVKTNVAGLAIGNLNVAGEFLIKPEIFNKSLTVNIPVSYNPFTYRNNVKLKHIAFQPELRMWFNQPFTDFFVGVHAHYAYYNAGGVSAFSTPLKERRYQGSLYGMGISGGYKHSLNNRFSLEASLGIGYATMKHDIYRCAKCGTRIGSEHKNYVGPTKATIAVVYQID